MNLKTKAILILLISISLSVLAVFSLSNIIFLNKFAQIEKNYSEKDLIRLREIIESEFKSTTLNGVGWSNWDETFNYMKKPEGDYLKKTYLIDSIFDSQFDEIIIADKNKNIIFSQSYDYNSRKFKTISKEKLDYLKSTFNKIDFLSTSPSAGLVYFDNKVDITSYNPILTSSGEGPNQGFILFTRHLDSQFLKKFESLAKYDIAISNIEKVRYDKIVFRIDNSNSKLDASLYIPDIIKENVVKLKMPISREISLIGKNSLIKFTLLLVFSLIIISSSIYYLINSQIISEIVFLQEELQLISENHTKRKRVSVISSDEIGKLSLNINKTLEKLEENQLLVSQSSKFSALGEMAGSIAHEINNPLTIILGYSKKIENQIKSDKFNQIELLENTQKIKSTVNRIDKIIKSLKLISRNADKDPSSPVQLGEIIDDIMNLCSYTLKEKQINIDLSEFDRDLTINVRVVQILQVFINLINNSIDAMENVEERWIKISTSKKDSKLKILFVDNGPKIPEVTAKKILQPFFTTKEIGKGTGLGLLISQNILKSHHGELTLDMNHKNTCFVLTLPIHYGTNELSTIEAA
jgi:signal transduction histidine kinase